MRKREMKQINIQYYTTAFAELILGSFGGRLCLLGYRYGEKRKVIENRIKKELNSNFIECFDEILGKTKKQLDEYFYRRRKKMDVPILTIGTDFQKKVWDSVMMVPYGTTLTYLELAENIDNKKAVRAVANANGANSIAIIIPCHRIMGSNGKLGGYSGGLTIKKQLLNLEKNISENC
jgi:methylated-DNA-[protein]-cysteine S-methyltransferase